MLQHESRLRHRPWRTTEPVEGTKFGAQQFEIENTLRKTLIWVVVSKIFSFHPYLGKIPNLTNIFQMGWFNHHLVMLQIGRPYFSGDFFFQFGVPSLEFRKLLLMTGWEHGSFTQNGLSISSQNPRPTLLLHTLCKLFSFRLASLKRKLMTNFCQ